MQTGMWAMEVLGACLAGVTGLAATAILLAGWRKRLVSRPAQAGRVDRRITRSR